MKKDKVDIEDEEISLKKMQKETLLESDVSVEILGRKRKFIKKLS